MSGFVNITGQRFGRLVSIRVVSKSPTRWECRCDCGTIKPVLYGNLVKGTAKSCGCLRKELMSKRRKLPDGIAARNGLFAKYRQRSKSNNMNFDLTLDDFCKITKQNCYYCGIQPLQILKEKRFTHGPCVYNGIDRVDNNKGYILENCVPCCETCNRAKRIMTQEEFYSWIDRVHSHIHTEKLGISK